MPPTKILETSRSSSDVNDQSSTTTYIPKNGNRSLLHPAVRQQLKDILHTSKAVRRGDFSIRYDAKTDGLIGEICEVLNDILATNENMANEFVRISKAVGQEGRLNQRASIGPVQGAWAKNMESVNSLISDLVHPTTEFSRVITSVAKGDLSQTMPFENDNRPLQGEFIKIATTVNTMLEQLAFFSFEVSRVAKEVGLEGQLGVQANSQGSQGIWKDITENVNVLAGNLTDQVRNIAKVATAVAKGDLSQKITVDAKGEIMELKNTINVMVDQLSS